MKTKLIFDGTILTNEFNKNDARTGIFFVGENIFNELLKRDDIEVSLYCALEKLPDLKRYLALYNLEFLEILNECEFGFLQKLSYECRKLKGETPKNKKIERAFYSIFYSVLKKMGKILNGLSGHYLLKKKIEDKDFYFSPVSPVPRVVKQAKHIKSAVMLHDTIPLIFSEYMPKRLKGNYWFIDLIKSLSKDEIYFANSKCTKDDFLKYCPELTEEQITVVYLAANDNFRPMDDTSLAELKTKYNIPKDGKYIFSLCTMDPRKNLIFAVKNFVEFIKRYNIQDMYFVLGGAAWHSFIHKIEEEIGDLGEYKDKIIKAGYVDDCDLPVLFSNAFCFVYPSLYEGFGLPVLEAMKCGAPVITSNVSSIPEIIGDAGIQIDPKNNEEFIQAINKFYTDESFKAECSQRALERAQEFSWERCVEIIVKTYRNR